MREILLPTALYLVVGAVIDPFFLSWLTVDSLVDAGFLCRFFASRSSWDWFVFVGDAIVVGMQLHFLSKKPHICPTLEKSLFSLMIRLMRPNERVRGGKLQSFPLVFLPDKT